MDTELISRYCLDCAGILFLTDLVREAFQNDTKRSNPLIAELKVIIALTHLAAGKHYWKNAVV